MSVPILSVLPVHPVTDPTYGPEHLDKPGSDTEEQSGNHAPWRDLRPVPVNLGSDKISDHRSDYQRQADYAQLTHFTEYPRILFHKPARPEVWTQTRLHQFIL